jgi:hypothetical protein
LISSGRTGGKESNLFFASAMSDHWSVLIRLTSRWTQGPPLYLFLV